MKEAMLYERLDGGKVRCALCAHRCTIAPGRRGICHVRENRDGTLQSLVYGRLIAMNVDPIEKKPLFHFLPGSLSFSIATVGCNFRCLHCQNYDISQFGRDHPAAPIPGRAATPEDVVSAALRTGCRSISYTYTEPTIFMEFAIETATLARKQGLANVFVSNGFMTPESARAIAPVLDADNIDLKGDDEFYKKVCGARVGPVRETIALMRALGVWVEVTTLIIPGYNDRDETLRDIARFLASVDKAIPWHVSRFHPTYKLLDAPPTPAASLQRAREIGRAEGLRYVYTGNVPGDRGEHTLCPSCGRTLVEREGFEVLAMRVGPDGLCPDCGEPQQGVWSRGDAPAGTRAREKFRKI
jgi:pyruvate formate lyase activating enzyme